MIDDTLEHLFIVTISLCILYFCVCQIETRQIRRLKLLKKRKIILFMIIAIISTRNIIVITM